MNTVQKSHLPSQPQPDREKSNGPFVQGFTIPVSEARKQGVRVDGTSLTNQEAPKEAPARDIRALTEDQTKKQDNFMRYVCSNGTSPTRTSMKRKRNQKSIVTYSKR